MRSGWDIDGTPGWHEEVHVNRNEDGTNRDGDEPHKLDVVGKAPALLEVMLDTNAIDALTDDETLLQIVEEATAVGVFGW